MTTGHTSVVPPLTTSAGHPSAFRPFLPPVAEASRRLAEPVIAAPSARPRRAVMIQRTAVGGPVVGSARTATPAARAISNALQVRCAASTLARASASLRIRMFVGLPVAPARRRNWGSRRSLAVALHLRACRIAAAIDSKMGVADSASTPSHCSSVGPAARYSRRSQ